MSFRYLKLKEVGKIVAIVAVGFVSAGFGAYALAAATGMNFATFGSALSAMVHGGLFLGKAIAAGAMGGFASGFAGSLLNGGNISEAFKSGLIGGAIGGLSGGLTFAIGNMAGDLGYWGTAVAHGAIQGGAAELQGAEFRHGFYSGFAAGATSSLIGLARNVPGL